MAEKNRQFNVITALVLKIIAVPASLLTILTIHGQLNYNHLLLVLIADLIAIIYLIYPLCQELALLSKALEELKTMNPILPAYLQQLDQISPISTPLNHLFNKLAIEQTNNMAIMQEYSIIIDNLPDILFILDGEMQILNANKCANLIFGQELKGKNLGQIIPDKILSPYIKWLLHDQQSKQLELYLPEPYNIYLLARLMILPLYHFGKASILLLMTDISETKRTEQMFNDFVANASHEIKTPLTSIKGFIELMQNSAKDDPKACEQFLQIMAGQVERLNNLVIDLLSLSKLEREANLPPEELIDLKAIIDIVVTESLGSRKAKNMAIKLEVDDQLPLIRGDMQQLIRLLGNLVSNSVKYANADSAITIYCHSKQCGEDNFAQQYFPQNQQLVKIIVADQGEGIAKEHLPRLTERFYMVDASRSRDNQAMGTGLGLAIARQIIMRHGGALKIESTVNIGSQFTIFLPVG